ncbi:hypothetical protein LEP1GSC088_2461 [Leptospira interrogans str. L1207]|nr:hypothetical protein LEP1GSC088_2461 [Leptospira interrogans str. L1207]
MNYQFPNKLNHFCSDWIHDEFTLKETLIFMRVAKPKIGLDAYSFRFL